MLIIDAKCKFCKCDLHLEVDDSYSALRDPFGLFKLAACNRCSDLRARRRRLHESFVRASATLIADPKSAETRQQMEDVFVKLTKIYLRLISEWTDVELPWEQDMIGPFMHTPKALSSHLKRLWGLANQTRLAISNNP